MNGRQVNGRFEKRIGGMLLCALLAASGIAIATDAADSVPAAADPGDCTDSILLLNGGFENPVLPGSGGYGQVPQADVPNWSTTDVKGSIEIWQNGFGGGGTPVPSAEGNQFAELNAYSAGTLYQDIATTPGQTITWSLQHRGRAGDDTMRVIIGDPATPLDQLQQSGPNLTDGNTAWGTHTGGYVVPAGQTVTRFGFQAVSAAGGIAAGNFLDDITFGTGPCLESTKRVEKLTNLSDPETTVGDRLRYTIDVVNRGNGAAANVVSRDALPAGVEFVPGSITIAGAAVTDNAGDDAGEHAGGAVSVRLGTGADSTAGGALARDATASYSFDVLVTEAAGGTTVTNTAQVGFIDPIADEERTGDTNEVATPVVGRPALALTKSSTPSGAADYRAGEKIKYIFVVENTGNVTVKDISIDELDFSGTGDLSAVTCESGASALAPRDTVTCEAQYELTQEDIEAGKVSNTAAAVGSFDDTRVVSEESSTSLTATPAPGLELEKTADVEQVVRVGDRVTYSFALTNTGNVSLRDPEVLEQEFSGAGELSKVVCPESGGVLLPGKTLVCTATYEVVAGDLTGDPLTNTATAVAIAPDDAEVEAPISRAEVSSERPVKLEVPEKTAKPKALALTGAGSSAGAHTAAMCLLLLGAAVGALSALRSRNRA